MAEDNPGVMAGVPRFDVDLYSDEIVADPWPMLAAIREAGPIVWNEKGFWMTGRDRVCRRILNKPPALGQEGMISSFFGADAFISIDNKAAHGALRNVWASAFSRESVAKLSAFVRQVVHQKLEKAEAQLRDGAPEVDLFADMCRPLPAYVIAYMLGVEDDMIASVIEWSDYMADATSSGFPIDYDNDPAWLASEAAKKELAAYLYDQMRYRRTHPGDDLISRIVQSEVAKTLSDEAIMVNTRQLLFAGNETTAKWLGHIVQIFAERPDIRAALAADRALLPGGLEEIMRWQGVTQTLPRGVNADGIVVEGVALPKGTEIVLLLGAANRDPERYERPDELDIHRPSQPHLGFGFALHSCLGAVLARMEALEVATGLLDHFPAYRITRPVTYGGFSLRGPSALWVALQKD